MDDNLYSIIFGKADTVPEPRSVLSSAKTGETSASFTARKGQVDFSENVRKNFDHRCCFPGCNVTDRSFLVGSHIARWSDHPDLRGETSNGLCLCLMHDKAFEIGLFTLDSECKVRLNREMLTKYSENTKMILDSESKPISKHSHPISADALSKHWTRIGYRPV